MPRIDLAPQIILGILAALIFFSGFTGDSDYIKIGMHAIVALLLSVISATLLVVSYLKQISYLLQRLIDKGEDR